MNVHILPYSNYLNTGLTSSFHMVDSCSAFIRLLYFSLFIIHFTLDLVKAPFGSPLKIKILGEQALSKFVWVSHLLRVTFGDSG